MTANTDLLAPIISAIISTGELDDIDWTEFSLIAGIDEDYSEVNETYGYAYTTAGESVAISCRPSKVNDAIIAYREWLRLDDHKGFIKTLIQFNRVTGKFNVDFEYEDDSRWNVRPSNIDSVVEELRPRLGN